MLTGCHLVVAVGWSGLRTGLWPTSGGCQALGPGVASQLRLQSAAASSPRLPGPWAAEVTAAPTPSQLPTAASCSDCLQEPSPPRLLRQVPAPR